MPDNERAILTYGVLTRLDASIEEIKTDIKEIKQCVDTGALADNRNDAAIKEAKETAVEAKQTAELANSRIDKFIIWLLVLLITTIAGAVAAYITFLVQKGM